MNSSLELDSPKDIQLFPLRVVMFPGSRLDLQIFEQEDPKYIMTITHYSELGFGLKSSSK